MTATILVPLDGSPLAERALRLGARVARASSARLVLARVLPSSSDASQLDMSDVQTYLEAVAVPLRKDNVVVETATAFGNAACEILRTAHEHAADLLLMSTHGRSGPGRWLYGSVADEVLRRSDLPVMVLGPDAHPELTCEGMPRILVPLDGSTLCEAALGPAREWAARLGAELILVRVVYWPPVVYANSAELMALDPDDDLRLAEEYLEEVATRWRSPTTPIRFRAVLARIVPTGISSVAAEEKVDVIAMATHGRSGLARLVLGSVATGTLQRADVPILLVRPPAMAAA